jgi:hypothetical protein
MKLPHQDTRNYLRADDINEVTRGEGQELCLGPSRSKEERRHGKRGVDRRFARLRVTTLEPRTPAHFLLFSTTFAPFSSLRSHE